MATDGREDGKISGISVATDASEIGKVLGISVATDGSDDGKIMGSQWQQMAVKMVKSWDLSGNRWQ